MSAADELRALLAGEDALPIDAAYHLDQHGPSWLALLDAAETIKALNDARPYAERPLERDRFDRLAAAVRALTQETTT